MYGGTHCTSAGLANGKGQGVRAARIGGNLRTLADDHKDGGGGNGLPSSEFAESPTRC
jgi:hypothetical protein